MHESVPTLTASSSSSASASAAATASAAACAVDFFAAGPNRTLLRLLPLQHTMHRDCHTLLTCGWQRPRLHNSWRIVALLSYSEDSYKLMRQHRLDRDSSTEHARHLVCTLMRAGAKERLISSADFENPVGCGTTGRCCSGRHAVARLCPAVRATEA